MKTASYYKQKRVLDIVKRIEKHIRKNDFSYKSMFSDHYVRKPFRYRNRTISIHASSSHYCSPRESYLDHYDLYEVMAHYNAKSIPNDDGQINTYVSALEIAHSLVYD